MRIPRTALVLLTSTVPAAVVLGVALMQPHLAAEPRRSGGIDGQSVFRYDTFGDEQLWTGVLQMQQPVATLPPATALAVGLKVDLDALPAGVVQALRTGAVDLQDPAVTRALLQLNAVVGVKGTVDATGQLVSVGVTCALCHSTVDDALAKGIGHRLDGWANADLNVGAIVALSPVLDAQTRATFSSWGPGRYDPRHHMFDGTNITPLNATSVPVVIPPIYGLGNVDFETYTGDGPIGYWNAYVGVTQMGGHGSFTDGRLGISVSQTPDLVTPKLSALVDYERSLRAPRAPKGSIDRAAAERGEDLFEGRARCTTCHRGSSLTDVSLGGSRQRPILHDAAETGMDPAYAQRSATGKYRTTPLRGLWPRQAFFHDGRAAGLGEVVDHYNRWFNLGLSAAEQRDLAEYLRSL